MISNIKATCCRRTWIFRSPMQQRGPESKSFPGQSRHTELQKAWISVLVFFLENPPLKMWHNSVPTDIKQNGTLLKGWQLKSSIKEFCHILRGRGGVPKVYSRKFPKKFVFQFVDSPEHFYWTHWGRYGVGLTKFSFCAFEGSPNELCNFSIRSCILYTE